MVVRFRFSRRRVTRLRPAGEKHVEKRCGADSASERGVCRRRFERWQIVMGGHTRQRGEGEYRTRLANNRGVTTTGIEVFLIYYVILLARKKRILLLAHTGSTIVRRIHTYFLLFFFHTSNTRNTTNSIIIIIIIISREDVVFCSCFSRCESAASGDAVSTLSGEDATTFSGRISQRD